MHANLYLKTSSRDLRDILLQQILGESQIIENTPKSLFMKSSHADDYILTHIHTYAQNVYTHAHACTTPHTHTADDVVCVCVRVCKSGFYFDSLIKGLSKNCLIHHLCIYFIYKSTCWTMRIFCKRTFSYYSLRIKNNQLRWIYHLSKWCLTVYCNFALC